MCALPLVEIFPIVCCLLVSWRSSNQEPTDVEREKKSPIFQLNGKRLSSYTRRNKFEFVEVVGAAAAKRMRIRDGHGAHLRHIRSCVESERSVPLFLSKLKKE